MAWMDPWGGGNQPNEHLTFCEPRDVRAARRRPATFASVMPLATAHRSGLASSDVPLLPPRAHPHPRPPQMWISAQQWQSHGRQPCWACPQWPPAWPRPPLAPRCSLQRKPQARRPWAAPARHMASPSRAGLRDCLVLTARAGRNPLHASAIVCSRLDQSGMLAHDPPAWHISLLQAKCWHGLQPYWSVTGAGPCPSTTLGRTSPSQPGEACWL